MPLQHAVLALLAIKPSHGYELKTSFDQAVGEQWGGLNIGHVYQLLDRLGKDGLIESERQPQPVKPDRMVHRITPAGRAELARWLTEPSARTRGYRDDFFLKLMAAVQAGDQGVLASVIRQQRAHLLRELRGLHDATAALDRSPVDSLLLVAAELHVQADLGVVDAAEQALTAGVVAGLRAGQAGAGLGAAMLAGAGEAPAPAQPRSRIGLDPDIGFTASGSG